MIFLIEYKGLFHTNLGGCAYSNIPHVSSWVGMFIKCIHLALEKQGIPKPKRYPMNKMVKEFGISCNIMTNWFKDAKIYWQEYTQYTCHLKGTSPIHRNIGSTHCLVFFKMKKVPKYFRYFWDTIFHTVANQSEEPEYRYPTTCNTLEEFKFKNHLYDYVEKGIPKDWCFITLDRDFPLKVDIIYDIGSLCFLTQIVTEKYSYCGLYGKVKPVKFFQLTNGVVRSHLEHDTSWLNIGSLLEDGNLIKENLLEEERKVIRMVLIILKSLDLYVTI